MLAASPNNYHSADSLCTRNHGNATKSSDAHH
jgi:hypothetical protein